MHPPSGRLLAVFLCAIATTTASIADELRLDAHALFSRSVVHDVRLSADRQAIELESGRLYEDDGPAAGYSYKPNEERLTNTIRACKELDIENAACRAATLLIGSRDPFVISVNGRDVAGGPVGRTGSYWQSRPIPVDALRSGTNRFCLSGLGKLWIARADEFASGSITRSQPPGRSLRSGDGGATWNRNRLGPQGDLAGEYYVRLYLDQFRSAGTLLLPVMDVANLAERPLAPPVMKAGRVRITMDADIGAESRVRWRIRSSPTPAAENSRWSEWRELPRDSWCEPLTGRYVQLAIDLTTDNPLATPRIRSLRLETAPELAAHWTREWKTSHVQNPPIVRSSVPFVYESYDQPSLRELRQRFRLDDVVDGAKSEFELITRLAAWSAKQWERGHLGEAYPAWNWADILRKHADGQPTGGFCQQYNLVFLQACESFGIPGRCVSIGPGDYDVGIRGGHEVVELWSNDFGKWIYVDGNMAWYATDPQSDVPLSLWELRQRQLPIASKQPPAVIRVVHLQANGKRWEGLHAWPGFLELRLIPRSNFLAQRAPLPLNQGMRGWFWTGHYVWTDEPAPASQLYGHRVTDRRNWEWTVNDMRLWLEATTETAELRVHLETTMPGFDRFEATIDGGRAMTVPSVFSWRLHSGDNQLSVQARNTAGRASAASHISLKGP